MGPAAMKATGADQRAGPGRAQEDLWAAGRKGPSPGAGGLHRPWRARGFRGGGGSP